MNIHIFYEVGKGWEIWFDSEDGEKDGVCIGSHSELTKAIDEAKVNLQQALLTLGK